MYWSSRVIPYPTTRVLTYLCQLSGTPRQLQGITYSSRYPRCGILVEGFHAVGKIDVRDRALRPAEPRRGQHTHRKRRQRPDQLKLTGDPTLAGNCEYVGIWQARCLPGRRPGIFAAAGGNRVID